MAGAHVQMFVLGSLMQGEAHGYQLLARARSWGVEDWAGFGAGSIYNALGTLEKRGMVVRSGTEQHGGYAPATVYAITDEGREELRELLSRAAGEVVVHDPFDLATPFLGLLPVEERKALIESHIASLERRLAEGHDHYAHVQEHHAEAGEFDWALAAMEKVQKLGAAAVAASRELLTRCETWGPPPPLPRAGSSGDVKSGCRNTSAPNGEHALGDVPAGHNEAEPETATKPATETETEPEPETATEPGTETEPETETETDAELGRRPVEKESTQ